ncbi:MAG: maleylpyruvate isomerase family mycothiol-dependent enzyme [Nocardioides sp.]|nr:maleylpyruvate isomerase family mycothiol-dependent enzyme [Nocardioides sp.]
MDVDTLWKHIHHERRALADTLADLSAEEWENASACPGWRVRDVAAHVISHPQISWGSLLGSLLRERPTSFDTMILRDARRRGRAPVEQILADYATYDGSRAHAPMTTPLEPLIDILVHSQDILRPLGRTHAMPVDAAAAAADRALTQGRFLGRPPGVQQVRMVATDTGWSHGDGPVVEGPIQELLLLCAGRTVPAARLAGSGVALVRAA